MKLVTYAHHNQPRVGAVVEESIVDLSAVAGDMLALIDQGEEGLVRARELVEGSGPALPLSEASLLSPIPIPRRNVMCLGLNYAEHAAESAAAAGRELVLPEVPIIFTKATNAVIGPYDNIPFDPAASEEIDWEVELAFVVGREGKNIPREEAMAYVFGYTVINDISARDFQRRGRQFFKGKSLDGACPMGPWIVTADELADISDLRLTCTVNGTVKQDNSTRELIFDIPAIIAYLSRGMTLWPGDVVATGTPSGVGFARQPPEFLRPGDEVACAIEGIGEIRNLVVET